MGTTDRIAQARPGREEMFDADRAAQDDAGMRTPCSCVHRALWILLAARACSFSAPAAEGPDHDVRVFGLIERFQWSEHYAGRKILEESGPLFGIGAEGSFRLREPLWAEVRAELFLGDVDYDGFVQYRESIEPFESTTSYTGVGAEGDLAVRFAIARDLAGSAFAGFGLRTWDRALATELADDEIGEHGYEESWTTVYGLLGFLAEWTASDSLVVFGRVRLSPAIANRVDVDLSNVGGPSDIELEPDPEVSFTLDVGLNWKRFSGSVFYETRAFGESPLDDKYGLVFQPESEAEIVGVRAGVRF
jgi:hypothetical protein